MDLNCQDCDTVLRKERGCDEKGIMPFMVDGAIHFRCPVKLITEQSNRIMRAYSMFKAGFLPHAGGWINETKKFIDSIIIVNNEINRIDKIHMGNATKKGKK